MKKTFLYLAMLTLVFSLSSCKGGSTGSLTGRVVDGFGNPLGGDAVFVKLTSNPAFYHPDQWGNFIIHAPTGNYELIISFSNPAAGFDYKLKDIVTITTGSKNLGQYTLLNIQNKDAWEAYRNKNWAQAISKFNEQASLARGGQVFLPYMRFIEGEENQNTLLTQGILSAENGLGWTYARGLGDIDEAKMHFEMSMCGGYLNYDAMVGLSGIAIGEGDGKTAADNIQKVLNLPGIYDCTEIHDKINETDLMAVRSLAEFLQGFDGVSRATAQEIASDIEKGNPASRDLLKVLSEFR